MPPSVTIDLDSIHRALDLIPNKVLNAIKSSNNNHKGDFGEFVGFLKLKAEYDRVIPFGNITDFICISFPKEDKEGKIVFVDIKTGNAKLSKDQTMLKNIIKNKQIEFIKYHIDVSDKEEPCG